MSVHNRSHSMAWHTLDKVGVRRAIQSSPEAIPPGSVNGLTDGTLLGRNGDGFSRVLETGDALCDGRHEFRSVAL